MKWLYFGWFCLSTWLAQRMAASFVVNVLASFR
jgi:hypothetical protein